jgi:hypothetical protein
MRNMAYGVTISKVDDIEGKDKIGLLHFKENAYTVIGSKKLKPGDVVCYFEVDSILPETPVFEFLRKRCYNERCKGFLIRKIKMSNVYSFGLVMTSEELKTEIKAGEVYDDVFNVRKDEDRYDASPKQFNGKELARVRSFPVDLIPKSDEDNLMNDPSMLDKIKDKKYYTSVKLEGKSMTVFLENRSLKDVIEDIKYNFKEIKKEFEFIFKKIIHRNKKVPLKDQITKHLLNIKSLKNPFYFGKELAVFGRNVEGDKDMYAFCERLKPFFKDHPNLILQGEYTSPKVQKGIYKDGENFNVYRVRNGLRDLNPDEYCDMINGAGIKGFRTVQYLDIDLNRYDLESLQKFVDNLKFTEGSHFVVYDGDKNHEGIVIRTDDMKIHFKVKSREYGL